MKFPTSQLQQIHLGVSPHGYEPVTSYEGDASIYSKEHETVQATLLRFCPAHIYYKGSNEASCPRPILVTIQHLQQLERFHGALTAAISDIVERWWTDVDARFPERMPLEREEEDLLRWLQSQRSHNGVPYRDRLGSWRPDFMVEDRPKNEFGRSVEAFRLTEINARFCFNGFMHQAYGQEALSDLGVGRNGIIHATDSSKILGGLLSLFQPDRPLHLLKGDEPGIDIHMFVEFVHRHVGIKPRLITPDDLRLVPDAEIPGKYKLCCLVDHPQNTPAIDESSVLVTSEGEAVEEIHQVGLELHQRELFALSTEMRRQISLRCFNDMRTVLLVHDKRMLGIIQQEIPTLVARDVLSPEQGEALKRGIAHTIIPGSSELNELVQMSKDYPERKNEYLLKPIRGGKGAGIVFGDEISPSKWLSILEDLRNPQLVPGTPSFVIQRRIWPRLYDVVLKSSGEQAAGIGNLAE
ncbi:hypothetical protein EYZ11_003924 [Aspergillus tanneri]|uniref:Uncharacterized protein n=1 Tax=Aspergillus tanneri TaxID=1220188 RepID=A0A4V3UPV3_9EURO|nr:hypothetical protein EYZ11_003924 [Aspergillus tanneri]